MWARLKSMTAPAIRGPTETMKRMLATTIIQIVVTAKVAITQ